VTCFRGAAWTRPSATVLPVTRGPGGRASPAKIRVS
jgi:hypothetical protein